MTSRPASGGHRCARGLRCGFTLVEMLVALFITAILFAMGYSALTQALTSRKEVEEQAARLNGVQQALRVLEQDFELMQPRPVRDLLGTGYQNALVVGVTVATCGVNGSSGASASSTSASSASTPAPGLPLLSFTRGGWANPAGLPRSELQRVSYLLRDDKLIRQHLPELDTTAAVPAVERELLDKVESVGFRYMDGSLNWSCTWPTVIGGLSSAQDILRARPVAVEISLKLKDWGTLVRIVEVAG